MNTSLANLDFGEQSITIYGTQNDPLIKCSDLIKNVLGYTRVTDCKPFRKLRKDVEFVQCVVATQQEGDSPCSRMFMERGIYAALISSVFFIQFKKNISKQ